MNMFRVVLVIFAVSAALTPVTAQTKKSVPTYQVRVVAAPVAGAPSGPFIASALSPIHAAWLLVIDQKGDDLEVFETDREGFTKLPQLVGKSWIFITAPGFEPTLVTRNDSNVPLLVQMNKVK